MGTRDYSTVAASNLTVQGISLAEGMARASVNNSMRAQLADIADLLLDLGGATATTGSATAYLVALPTAPSSYANNLLFLATSHVTNTGAATINVSGVGVKAIEKIDSGAAVPLVAGDFPAGHIGIFAYSSANNSFILLNAATAGLVGTGFGVFETLADGVAASVPSSVNMLMTLSYATAGDCGGAIWVRVGASEPTHAGKFQSADNDWWEINSNKLDVRMFGTTGDGTTDDFAAFVSASNAADTLGRSLYVNQTHKINSDLTMSALLEFGPSGRLKPASGKTITLTEGFTATPTQHIFDLSLGGYCWATKECAITARNYGAVGDAVSATDAFNLANPGTDDRAAFQALIDCRLYFMQARAVHLDAGDFYIGGGPLIVNYGDAVRTVSLIGAGDRYGPGGNNCGTWLRFGGHWGNGIEVQGCRGMHIVGIGFEGPAYNHLLSTGYGSAIPGVSDPDPYSHLSWMPAAANAIGSLCRYKTNAGIHIDPRCGTKPVAVSGGNVRLVVTTALNATQYENGDSVQGVTLATGNLILQALPIDVDGWPGDTTNGVYTVQASGAPVFSTAAADTYVTCTAGDHTGETWVCNNHTVSVGSTNIDYRQFDGTLSYADYTYPVWPAYPALTPATTQYDKQLSSAVTVSHCIFRGFGVAFAVKGCNSSSNADFMQMEFCASAYPGNVYTFAWGNSQGRLQSTLECRFSAARCHASASVIGQQAGKPHFSAVNTLFDGCVDIIDIPTMALGGGVSLTTCYSEGANRIGRVTTGSTSGSGFEIAGGHFGMPHAYWKRAPRWIIDCRNVGVVISPSASFSFLSTPLVIRADPRLCHVWAKMLSPIWMTGAASPSSITVGEAIMLHSTMGVLFNHDAARRQGPWTGGGLNEIWSVATGASRSNKRYGQHTTSSVTDPIPFCSATVAPADLSGYDGAAAAIPVALGSKALSLTLGNVSHFTGSPSQTGRTLTLVLASTPTLSNAQNQGLVAGSVICDLTTGNLFVITALSTATITAKQLNNYYIEGGGPRDNEPIYPSAAPDVMDFYPTGHYTPYAGLELTYTVTPPGTAVTFRRSDGTTSDNAQLPVGAAKMVNNSTDAMAPVLRANSAITASVAGTITMAGAARTPLPGPTLSGGITVTTITEPAGIWFVPRP